MIQFGNDKIKEIYHGSDKIKEVYNGSELVYTAHDPVVIMTSATNAPVMAICYAQGWCASPDVMNDIEASMVTSIGSAFTKSSGDVTIKSFDEFQYFIGVTSLPDNAFQNNSGMTSITIPNSITSLGDSCFHYCLALTSITIPNSVASLGYRCFYQCIALTSITIPNSVTSIGNTCFSYCSALTSITIPNSVTSLGSTCFASCSALTSITIPNSVTSLGNNCFYGCRALTSIYSLRSTAPGLASNPFGASSTTYTGRTTYDQGVNMLYVPQGATGYDAGYWLDPLQNATKCGFTISYTL